jgi:DNA-binding MarR family transcriptional regulator
MCARCGLVEGSHAAGLPELEEDVLDDLFRLVRIPEDPQHKTVDPRCHAVVELRERRRVTAARRLQLGLERVGPRASETPPLSDEVCFDLYAASRAVTNAYRPMLSKLGLTYPQFLVLIVLWDEGTRTVRELADVLRLYHGTLTPLLRRMEAGGLVTRRRANADERFVEIALTASGDRLRVHATKIHCDMKGLLGLDDAQFAALQTTLRELTASVSGRRLTRYPLGVLWDNEQPREAAF